MNKKCLLVGLLVLFAFSFVLAENETIFDDGNLTTDDGGFNESFENGTIPKGHENLSEANYMNYTNESLNEIGVNETISDIGNLTMDDWSFNESFENGTQIDADLVDFELDEEENIFEVLSDMMFSILSYIANSTNYGLNLFAIGAHSGESVYEGDSFTFLLSNYDGMTGDAESSSYLLNVGPLSRYTNFTQCFRTTCSNLGHNCGTWNDSCGGYLNCGTCSSGYECFSGTCLLDEDNDSTPDSQDNLVGESGGDIIEEGFSNVVVRVNGSTNLTQNMTGELELDIYDGSDIVVNFTHNFSAGKIYLSRMKVIKGSNYLIANLSGQLLAGETKVMYITDNNFISLCVEDAEISSVSDISSGCNGANEYNFTGCLGNNTGYTLSGITCTDLGSTLKIENLTHSGIKGEVAVSNPISPGGGGSSSSDEEEEVNVTNETVQEVVLVEDFEIEDSIPEELFDIRMDLDDTSIEFANELTAVVTYESFGSVPTPVNLTFEIFDANGNLVYSKDGYIVVTVEEVRRYTFEDLNLVDGEYEFVFTTLYNVDVKDEFRQNFTVGKKDYWIFYFWSLILDFWHWILGAFLLGVLIWFIIRIIKKYSNRNVGEKVRKSFVKRRREKVSHRVRKKKKSPSALDKVYFNLNKKYGKKRFFNKKHNAKMREFSRDVGEIDKKVESLRKIKKEFRS